MVQRRTFLSGSAVVAFAAFTPAVLRAAPKRTGTDLPPLAPIEPVTETLPGGIRVTDNYRWMEGAPTNPRLAAWLAAQDDHARANLDALAGRDRLGAIYDRIVEQRDDVILVDVRGDRRLLVKIDKAKPWPRYVLADGRTERVLLDPKSDDKTGNIDHAMLSPDMKTLAYGVSTGGRENGGITLLDLASGQRRRVHDARARVTGFTADSRGVFSYRLRPDAKEGATDYRLGGAAWLHVLDSDPASDRIVMGPGEGDVFEPQTSDEPFVTGAANSRWLVGAHLVNDTEPNQIYTAPSADVLAGRRQWRRIAGPSARVERFRIDGERVVLLARGRNGLGELVAVDAGSGTFENGRILLAGTRGEKIRTFALARDGLYAVLIGEERDRLVHVSRDGRTTDVATGATRRLGTLVTDPGAPGAYFESFDTIVPYVVHKVAGPTAVPVATPLAPPPDVDLGRFAMTRVEVPARDGARVPLTLVHRPGVRLDGSNPLYLEAYGAYGTSDNGTYNPLALARVEAGMIYAYAAVRGGGEKGEEWHVAGMKATKPNTWRDAIDCARWLVANGWTSRSRLAISGTSAGGIMLGRAITEAPDQFAAAIGHVGVFNPLRFEQSNNGRGNAAEFGSLAKPGEVPGLLAMDSVQAARPAVRYPMTLLTTGMNDPRVDPWLVAKFAASLQRGIDGRRRTWLSVDRESGHSGSSNDARRRGFVDEMAFALRFTRGR